jgi:pimeloyl-ACP methyl ester carboxylesterase
MIVFVHGVPETAALWDKVRSHLGHESIALSLPGFGCPRPDGFGATKDDYLAWLLGELEAVEGPVDLVGHDWGAALTCRVAMAHGDRVRSWVTDSLNGAQADYVWHDFAQIWQTPGAGETFWADLLAAPLADQAAVFEGFGVARDDALALAAAADETMASCILDLYRSAVPNIYADWHDGHGPTAAPGMVLSATDDPFGDETNSRRAAAVLGARFEVLDGVGHWWALQAPAEAAAIIGEFVSSVG